MEDKCGEDRIMGSNYITAIEKRVDSLENKFENVESRINHIERTTAVSEEQVRTIFIMLNDIKTDIRKIDGKIDELEKKPAKVWDEVIKTVIIVITTGIITFFLSKLLT